MRFYRAKNDERVCLHCRVNILHGSEYVWLYSYNAKRVNYFHIECYRIWSDELFVKKLLAWRENLDPQVKRGRPKIHSNGKKINKLRALIRYHKQRGNTERVEELSKSLKPE